MHDINPGTACLVPNEQAGKNGNFDNDYLYRISMATQARNGTQNGSSGQIGM
jgi:hypothetical protein